MAGCRVAPARAAFPERARPPGRKRRLWQVERPRADLSGCSRRLAEVYERCSRSCILLKTVPPSRRSRSKRKREGRRRGERAGSSSVRRLPPRRGPPRPSLGPRTLAALPLAKDEPRSGDAPLSTRTRRTRSVAHVHVARAARESPAASLNRTAGQSGHSARSRCAHASEENVTHTQRGSKPKPRWGGQGGGKSGQRGDGGPGCPPAETWPPPHRPVTARHQITPTSSV